MRRKWPLHSREKFIGRERANHKRFPREVTLSFVTFRTHVHHENVPDWVRAEDIRGDTEHAFENPFYH